MAQNDKNALNDIQIDSNQRIGHSKRNKLKSWAILFLVILLVAGLISIPVIIYHYQKKSATTKAKSEDAEKAKEPAEKSGAAAEESGHGAGKRGNDAAGTKRDGDEVTMSRESSTFRGGCATAAPAAYAPYDGEMEEE